MTMELIVMIIIGVCLFMFSVYFTRWVFGIDKIIQNQKEQTNLLNTISENIRMLANSEIEKQNASKVPEKKENNILDQYKTKQQSYKIMKDNHCPACQNPVRESDKECQNCGLVFKE